MVCYAAVPFCFSSDTAVRRSLTAPRLTGASNLHSSVPGGSASFSNCEVRTTTTSLRRSISFSVFMAVSGIHFLRCCYCLGRRHKRSKMPLPFCIFTYSRYTKQTVEQIRFMGWRTQILWDWGKSGSAQLEPGRALRRDVLSYHPCGRSDRP